MSDTPRTDAHSLAMESEDFDVELARTYQHARQLERELAASQAAYATARSQLVGFETESAGLRADVDEWQALADRLAAPIKATVWRRGLRNAGFRHCTEENAETALLSLAAYEAAKKGES